MAIWLRFIQSGLRGFHTACTYSFDSRTRMLFGSFTTRCNNLVNNSLRFISIHNRSGILHRYYSISSVGNKFTNSLSVSNEDLNWIDFKANLLRILNENELKTNSKLIKLYETIQLQYHSCSKQEAGNHNTNINKDLKTIYLSNAIHLWFYQNLSKDQIYDHINNMINWNINLTSSIYSKRLIHKLLQSSELDIQLVTLEKYLIDNFTPSDSNDNVNNNKAETTNDQYKLCQNDFIKKFISIYDWDTMILLTNNVIKRGNWRFVPYYLTALIEKLNQLQIKNNNKGFLTENKRRLSLQRSFIKFLVELMTVLSNLNNWKLVLPIFKLITESVNNLTLSVPSSSSLSTTSGSLASTTIGNLAILNKPLLQILKLLRINGQNDEIFQIISYLNNKPIKVGKDGSKPLLNTLFTSFQFQKRLLLELLTTLRAFHDPKLSVQFLIASVRSPDMEQILNDLGLIGWIFNGEVSTLAPLELKILTSDSLNQFLNTNLKFKIDDLAPVLTELYLTVLKKNSMILSKEYNKDVLLKLYHNYINKLNSSRKNYYFWKNDSGVLMQFLKNIIFELNDHQLAFEILLDFYSQKLAKTVRIVTSKNKNITKTSHHDDFYKKIPQSYVNHNCPSTLLIQSSYKYLSMSQISKLLNIMQINRTPLNFNICCSMVLKLIHLKRYSDARLWYEKIYSGNFNVNHFILLYYVIKFDWPLPKNINKSIIMEINSLIKEDLLPQRLPSRVHDLNINKIVNDHNSEKVGENEDSNLDDGLDSDILFMDKQEPDEAVFNEISACLSKLNVKYE